MRWFRWRRDPLIGWDPNEPALWPSPSQRLLLRALVLDGAAALDAWQQWSAIDRPDELGLEEEALLATVYLEAGRLGVKPAVRARLRAAYAHNWARNQASLGRLFRVVHKLELAGIPCVVLKGAALLLVYYKDVGARTMADVDVLVREADLERAADVLEESGWRPPAGGRPPPEVIPYLHATPWVDSAGFSIDLHWRPFTTSCAATAEERFWQRTEVHESAFGRVRAPGAVDLLILMCFHGRKQERRAAGRWVVDAMHVIARADPPIDWEAVLEQSRAAGLLLPVRDALAYLRRELDAAVPSNLLDAAGSTPSPSEMLRYAHLSRAQLPERGLTEAIAGRWSRYVTTNRARGRASSLRGFVRYYLASKQWEWNAGGKRVPLRVVQAAYRRVRSFGA